MNKFFAIVRFTFIEHIRSRVAVLILIFAAFIFFSSFLFSKISGDQEIRIIRDSGLAAAELFALLVALFLSVRVILSEMESKTLYLIFSKPVKRHVYLIARYAGTALILTAGLAAMGSSTAALLALRGAPPDRMFVLSLLMMLCKICLIAAAGVFFSLLTTSSVTALVVSFLVWILGHGIGELEYLADGASGAARLVLLGIARILPDFRLLGAKELPDGVSLSLSQASGGLLYGLLYICLLLALSSALFRKKEL